MNEKLLVKKILEKPLNYKWSLQGLGMLRLYLSDEVRLHIWDSRYVIPNVSTFHTHPWDFFSTVVAGQVKNLRYKIADNPVARLFNMATIKCGADATITDQQEVCLKRSDPEYYNEGQSYMQVQDEIHESLPLNGTVTIVKRIFHPDKEHAKVFWPVGSAWVSAEPRTATDSEVLCITQSALGKWFQ